MQGPLCDEETLCHKLEVGLSGKEAFVLLRQSIFCNCACVRYRRQQNNLPLPPPFTFSLSPIPSPSLFPLFLFPPSFLLLSFPFPYPSSLPPSILCLPPFTNPHPQSVNLPVYLSYLLSLELDKSRCGGQDDRQESRGILC